jgi:hypothetical protein
MTMAASALLQAEGFTDIRFVDEPPFPANAVEQLTRGDVDLMVNYASVFIVTLDKGAATTRNSHFRSTLRCPLTTHKRQEKA